MIFVQIKRKYSKPAATDSTTKVHPKENIKKGSTMIVLPC